MLRRLFRLSAALAFAVSLADTGYVLLHVWPRAAPVSADEVRRALLLDGLLFSTFALHHSLLARTRVKRWLARCIRETEQRPVYVGIASALLLATMELWRPVGHHLYAAPEWARPLLTCLQVLGVLIVGLAARVIDPLELAGLRAPRGTVEIRGPYRWVRHPIYLGFLLIVWPSADLTGDRLWFAVLSTVYLGIAIPLEERSMRRALGSAYDAYRTRVRWRVLPGAY